MMGSMDPKSENPPKTRREMLVLGAVVTFGALLSACRGKSDGTSVPTPEKKQNTVKVDNFYASQINERTTALDALSEAWATSMRADGMSEQNISTALNSLRDGDFSSVPDGGWVVVVDQTKQEMVIFNGIKIGAMVIQQNQEIFENGAVVSMTSKPERQVHDPSEPDYNDKLRMVDVVKQFSAAGFKTKVYYDTPGPGINYEFSEDPDTIYQYAPFVHAALINSKN